jgi:hypothetical protein
MGLEEGQVSLQALDLNLGTSVHGYWVLGCWEAHLHLRV